MPAPAKQRLPYDATAFRNPVRLTEPVYAEVWRKAGLPGAPPRVYAQFPPGRILGWQPLQNRDVYITPQVMRGMRSLPFSVGRDREALQVLLHEYAHVAQPRVAKPMPGFGNVPETEPGADLWAQSKAAQVSRALHVSPYAPSQEFAPIRPGLGYPNEAHALTGRRDWRQYVGAGQFGAPVAGLPVRPSVGSLQGGRRSYQVDMS